MVNYGGDEVSALVLDIGTSSLRAGYAGDDTPKAIVPTTYGYIHESAEPIEANPDVDMADGGEPKEHIQPPAPKARLFIGQNGPSLWREGMHIANPMQDGLITDFTPIGPLISHTLKEVMRCDPSEHPILVTEPAWNSVANRERMAEIMFEEFQSPAFYIANTSVLNAFAAGKGTALVIDIGRSNATVTPVVDGFVLRKGMQFSAVPQLIQAHARHLLLAGSQQRAAIQLLPHQLIANKSPVEPGAPPRFTLREDRVAGTTNSWRTWAELREVDEWIQSVAGCLDQGWNDQLAASRPHRPYEFPTGYNTYFGPERFNVGEQYFFHNQQLVASNQNLPKPIPSLIAQSLQACDPEIRLVLMGNVVLTGGGSLLSGLSERLYAELSRQFQNTKIHAPGNPVERRYGAWLGGSILASLGTFHQLWISKEEWQEHGRAIVGQRCK